MATFNPDRGLLREQIESLRAQTGVEWHCFVSDDCSDDGKFEGLTEEIAGDERFTVSRSPRRLGLMTLASPAPAAVPADAAERRTRFRPRPGRRCPAAAAR